MTNTITRAKINERCKEAAVELTPDMPTENTYEAWEAFYDECDDFNVYEAAHEE